MWKKEAGKKLINPFYNTLLETVTDWSSITPACSLYTHLTKQTARNSQVQVAIQQYFFKFTSKTKTILNS